MSVQWYTLARRLSHKHAAHDHQVSHACMQMFSSDADLLPTILMGPALGAALVYGHEGGYLIAAPHRLRRTWRNMSKEVDTVIRWGCDCAVLCPAVLCCLLAALHRRRRMWRTMSKEVETVIWCECAVLCCAVSGSAAQGQKDGERGRT